MECGTCTLCCTLCAIEELSKPSGDTCVHCSTKCDIYDKRPASCVEFMCAYSQVEKASELLRPDNLGVVFEKLEDDLMFGLVNPKHTDFKHLGGQINALLKENINVVLIKEGNPSVYHLDNEDPAELIKRVYDIGRTTWQ